MSDPMERAYGYGVCEALGGDAGSFRSSSRKGGRGGVKDWVESLKKGVKI